MAKFNIRDLVTGSRKTNSTPSFVSGDSVAAEEEPQEVVEEKPAKEESEKDSE